MFADAPRVLEYLRRIGVPLLRDIAGLFEQRQIDVRLYIALRTRIAIPVPGAAEIATLLDDADTLHAGFAESRCREQAAEAAADDHNFDRVVQRLARETRIDIRIVHVPTEVAFGFDVLMIAVSTHALVALEPVPGTEFLGVEIDSGDMAAIIGGRIVTHEANFLLARARARANFDLQIRI